MGMTNPNLAALIEAVDSSDKRLAEKQKAMEQAVRDYDDAELEHKTLVRALMLVDGTRAEPAPAAKPTPERSPRERAAELIDGLGLNLDWSPEEIAGNLKANGHEFNMRTIRAAITLAAERRQKSSASVVDSAAAPRPQPPGVPGAGPDTPDISAFLDRRTKTQEAAE